MKGRERLGYLGVGSIGPDVPSSVEELTFDLWTSKPTRGVTPMCCYVTEMYEEGGNDLAVPDVKHTSCWEEGFWPDLAAIVAPLLLRQLRSVTIVNARGIVPTGAQCLLVISAIWAGVGTHDPLGPSFACCCSLIFPLRLA